MSDEFEDRERQELGELPEPVARQRREQYPPSYPQKPPHGGMVNMRPAAIAPDVYQQGDALREGKGAEIGSPEIPANVTSVYDARPINARDFMVTEYDFLSLTAPETVNVLEGSYQIPEGYVGVWRFFRWQPVKPISLSKEDLSGAGSAPYLDLIPKVTLLVDNIAVPDFQGLQFGTTMPEKQDCFVLGNSLSTFTIRVNVPQAYSDFYTFGGSMPFKLEIYGQLLLTSGKPLPFEIATQQFSGIDLTKRRGR